MTIHTRRSFRPSPRGSLASALGKPAQLEIVAPESPRPLELLRGITVDGDVKLTADDAALHELLISAAYEGDQDMHNDTVAIPMSHVLRYLGTEARRDAVKASLARLLKATVSFGSAQTDTRYEQVPLLVSWIACKAEDDVIHYSLPEPLRILMSDQRRYAHIELAALPTMRSKYSAALYKHLTATLKETGQKWSPGDDNIVIISGAADDVATWAGFPRGADGRVHMGKFKARCLDIVDADFRAVKAFKTTTTPKHASKPGKPLDTVEFALELQPPDHHQIRVTFTENTPLNVGGNDIKPFRVDAHIWMKAAEEFGAYHRRFFSAWLVAIGEMCSGDAISEGYSTRTYRGESLRAQIDKHGANAAAWFFCAEEAANADFMAMNIENVKLGRAAQLDRRERLAEDKKPAVRPREVTFENCARVQITVDSAHNLQAASDMVIEPLMRRKYTGTSEKTIRVYYNAGKVLDYQDIKRQVSGDDVMAVMKEFGRHLDGVQEYVA